MSLAICAPGGSAERDWPPLAVKEIPPRQGRDIVTPKLAKDRVIVRVGSLDLEEVETTDAGSAISDVESVCSSASMPEAGTRTPPVGPGWGGSRRRMPAPLHGRLLVGTRLETIPGTPNADGKWQLDGPDTVPPYGRAVTAYRSPPPAPPGVPAPRLLRSLPSPPPHNALVKRDVPTKPSAVFVYQGTPQTSQAPISPKKCAREAMLAKAQREARPLKVRLPAYATQSSEPAHLDPMFPVKKRVLFADLIKITAAVMGKLDMSEPVKKKPTDFLLAEPPRVIRPPPGLPAKPR